MLPKIEIANNKQETNGYCDPSERRKEGRYVVDGPVFTLHVLPDNECFQCELQDISRSGAALRADCYLAPGTPVMFPLGQERVFASVRYCRLQMSRYLLGVAMESVISLPGVHSIVPQLARASRAALRHSLKSPLHAADGLVLDSTGNRPREERGFVLVAMAAAAIALIGVMGLAIDMGRMFIVKNEVQTFADAAAVAGALSLDGTSTGITNARTAATNMVDKWNFSTTTVSSPTVEFATSSSGTWSTNPAGAGILYVRVTATVTPNLYFIPVVMPTKIYTASVPARAVAGQVDISFFPDGLAPFAAVATSTTAPYFGFTVGNVYDIQWPQYNSTRAHCDSGHPDNCFNSPPCADETAEAERSVVAHWGSNINGYWGYSANSDIAASILDRQQLAAVPVGYDFQLPGNCGLSGGCMSNGNKSSIGGYLDQRVNQDPANIGNVYSTYLADGTHNGRRLIVVPMVKPATSASGSDISPVVGYGQFLLESNATNGKSSSDFYTKVNGSDPFCAVYAGEYTVGSTGNGAGGATGASYVRMVQ